MPFDDDGNVISLDEARLKRKRKLPVGELTELQISDRLVDKISGDYRHCAQLGGWHVWTGSHWKLDPVRSVREAAKALAHELALAAAENLDADLFKAARRAGSDRGIDAILSLASSAPEVVFAPDMADTDPWALNVRNGTLDLRTGSLRPHARTDIFTKCAGTAYDPEAPSPLFDRFLEEVQPDPEIRAYLARLFGYAAVGLVREHIIGVLWGPGQNGKSVLSGAVSHALGDYAKPGPRSLIVADGGHEPHPTDVATCVGSRLVVVHETKQGASFDASKVKLLTGGDKLTARFMRQDFFAFQPSHTLVMLSNWKPSGDASDAALWRRIQLCPFEVVIPPERKDGALEDKIKASEAPGVLRWLVNGALEWQRLGLAPPASVVAQTEAYRTSEDTVGQFLAEACVKMAGVQVQAGVLYAAYRSWVEKSGGRPMRANDFAAELLGRGYERAETAKGRYYKGISLPAKQEDFRD